MVFIAPKEFEENKSYLQKLKDYVYTKGQYINGVKISENLHKLSTQPLRWPNYRVKRPPEDGRQSKLN